MTRDKRRPDIGRSYEGMIIYLATRVSGDPAYKDRCGAAAARLTEKGAIVLHTTDIPLGLLYKDYMAISYAMMEASDAVCLMPDWAESAETRDKLSRAELYGLEVFEVEKI